MDYNKRIEAKGFPIPTLRQDGDETQISYFKEHPNKKIRKSLSTLAAVLRVTSVTTLSALAINLYGQASDNDDLVKWSGPFVLTPLILALTYAYFKTNNIVKRHNKFIETKSVRITPSYNTENGSASIQAHYKF
jgi:hypothetical protein